MVAFDQSSALQAVANHYQLVYTEICLEELCVAQLPFAPAVATREISPQLRFSRSRLARSKAAHRCPNGGDAGMRSSRRCRLAND